MEDEVIIGLFGGVVGGILGVLGSIFASYYGPRKFEEWKENRKRIKYDEPRKKILRSLLNGEKKYRSITSLSRATGTSIEECQRLLIEIEARGIRLKGDKDGWVLIKNRPLENLDDDEEVEG